MKTTKELSLKLANALSAFNGTEKTVNDRIALRAALYTIITELPDELTYECEMIQVDDDFRTGAIDCINDQIALVGDIATCITAPCSSGCIGWSLLMDDYSPNFKH